MSKVIEIFFGRIRGGLICLVSSVRLWRQRVIPKLIFSLEKSLSSKASKGFSKACVESIWILVRLTSFKMISGWVVHALKKLLKSKSCGIQASILIDFK